MKCKDCKFWEDIGRDGIAPHKGFGFCDGIRYSDDFIKDDDMMFIEVDEGVYRIETHSDFGCALFADKETEEVSNDKTI